MATVHVRAPGTPGGRITLAYTDSGSGIPVIFYPPLGNTKDIYDLLLPHLTGAGRLITIDPPGVGESAPLAQGAFSVAAEVEILRAFLDALRIERAVVAGVSRGATVALQFALWYPERTIGVIAQGAIINSADFAEWEQTIFEKGRQLSAKLPKALSRFAEIPLTAGYLIHVPLHKDIHPDMLRREARQSSLLHDLRTIRRSMRGADTHATLEQMQDLLGNISLEPQLSELTEPLLLLAGENATEAAGAYRPVATFERIRNAVDPKLLTTEVLPKTAHLATFARAPEAAAAIRTFLQELETGEG